MSSTNTKRVTRAISKQLIEQIAEGNHTPTELASTHDLPLHRLARWATRPANARVLAGLAYLADMRTQMLLSRFRANAAIQLITIATNKEPTEMSRKACVDLLKADLNVFPRYRDQEMERAIEQAVDERAIINALEELGKEPGDD